MSLARALSGVESGGSVVMSVVASEMVSIPRAELDALKAELKRLRREAGRAIARARIETDLGPTGGEPLFSRDQLAEAWGISD